MTGEVIAAILHHIALLVMVGVLYTEYTLLRQDDIRPHVATLARIDLFYGIAALVLIAAGLSRVFFYGKGLDFYLATPFFHAKMTLVVLIALLSVPPTLQFIRWRRAEREGTLAIDPRDHKRMKRFVAIEAHLVFVIPILAVLMARGYGQ
ncbi:MAG: DUF2214 family protein [Pseudomonadota bacterium]